MKSVFETRFARVGEAGTHYQTVRIDSVQAATKWAVECMGSYFDERLDQEEFLIATLDTKLYVRRVVRITRGTLDASVLKPRDVSELTELPIERIYQIMREIQSTYPSIAERLAKAEVSTNE